MRTWMFGLTMAAALLLPAGVTAAECCSGAEPAQAQAGHQHEGGPTATAKGQPCCGAHDAKPEPATMPCCGTHDAKPEPAAMPCCGTHVVKPEPATTPCCGAHAAAPKAMTCCGVGVADDPKVALAGLGLIIPLPVQTMEVHFREPVQVGDAILMGWYVIEHDDDRMARGEPCTHIYEFDTMREPVATFHCTHLERAPAGIATVVLRPTVNPSVKALAEFQFSGERASHGAPNLR